MVRFVALSILVFLLAGCMTAPIYTVENAQVFTASGKPPTHAQVRQAVIQGAISKTWTIREIDPDTIEARLIHRTLEAVVTIDYSPQRYSIRYKDSRKLSYEDGNIHKRYNTWVRKLRAAIDTRLAGF